MSELIPRLVAVAGVKPDQARKAVAIVLGHLREAAPPGQMEALLSRIPEAAEFLPEGAASAKRGRFAAMMGAMAAVNELNRLGLDMGQIKDLVRETLDYARERAGDEPVDAVLASLPALKQFA